MPDVFRLRDDLDSLPPYVPGARPPAGRKVYKLSSNENAFPPLPGVASAVADAAADLNRYPDMAATELCDALGEHVGVGEERIVVGNGSVAVLETLLLASCRPGDEVVFAWRSFEAYPIAVHVAGATAVPVPLTPQARHDLPAMAAAVTPDTRAVLLCSPNNPTGPAIRDAELRAFLAAVPPTVLVVLDEAYTDFVTAPEAAAGLTLLDEHPNLVLLRTFSKAYGLAGLRVGYAVARPSLVRGLRSASTPFGVNSLAQAAALAALRSPDEVREQCGHIITARDEITAALREHGWHVPDAQGNFYWLPLGDHTQSFAAEALSAGAVVRAFGDEGVRVSIGEDEGNAIVLELATQWRHRNP